MHEDEFRARFHAALGDAPDEQAAAQRAAAALHRQPPPEEREGPPRAMVLMAVAVTGLVLVGLLGPRLLRAGSRATSPATAVVPADCRLPVVVTDARALVPQYSAGFVSLATGRFVGDPSAQGGSMPFSRRYVRDQWSPQGYDPVLKRWLPVRPSQVSPDHRAYVYILASPLATGKGGEFDSTTLHVYDVTTGRDHALWTSHDQLGADPTWRPDGIHVQTYPAGGGQDTYWTIDPATGAAARTAAPASAAVLATAMRTYRIDMGVEFGTDGAGRPILLDAGSGAGAPQVYFVGGPNGRRIVIHSGRRGDAVDFEVDGFVVDGERLWAANRDATAIWLWSATGGLKRFPMSGVASFDGSVTPRLVGPCV
ncbi:MAG TPA: hypothetical protein VE953_27555 [Terriglobales bacterium]|nr:hypothetical protein [Terriglobales bacterium]